MLFATLTSFLVLTLATDASPSSRIVGGIAASSGQFPFIVQIQVNGQHQCAGYIYNSKWVVTTASCVYGLKTSQLKVVVGQLSLTSVDVGEKSYDVLINTYHPSYDAISKKNNIAMLELSGSITFGSHSTYIVHGDLPLNVTMGTLIGWGGSITGTSSNSLQYNDVVPILTDGSCPEISSWDPNLMICAGSATVTACTGDGGGPLVIGTSSNYVIVGLVSHLYSCNSQAAFTRLSYYTNWMQRTGGSAPVTTQAPSATSTTSSFSPSSTTEQGSTTVSHLQTCKLAEAGQFRFIVSIGDKYGRHFCSGFIHNMDFIITTATCANKLTLAETFVTPGYLRPSGATSSDRFSVMDRISNNLGDIALLRVSPSLVPSIDVGSIPIEEADYIQPSSTISGWGSTEANGCVNSLDLLWDTTKITTNNKCDGIANFNSSTMICVETSNNFRFTPVGQCHFESGAPLVQGDFTLAIGIKSSVEESCVNTAQGLTAYTRLSTFVPWINEHTILN